MDYLDERAQPQTLEAEDFVATVFQHELDHLDGVLFVDRVETLPGETALSFTQEYDHFVVQAQLAPEAIE